jgi:hypothetical protein
MTVITSGRSHLISEEDPMISQDRANPQAVGLQPRDAGEPAQSDGQGSDGPCAMPFDYIDEALEESMVASDPPALTPETAIGPPSRDTGRARPD